MWKNTQTIQINYITMNSFNITQKKYFIAVSSHYEYSKVSKTILFTIFEFTDLKLWQKYSNSPFGI